jgi:regulator of protease activity HflC (stomatin/prohibitin superfamily)
MENTYFPLCLFGGSLLVTIIVVSSSIRVLPEYQRLVIFRLGRCIGSKGPGIVLLIPFIDKGIRVDMREQDCDLSDHPFITKDQTPVYVDLIISYKVRDPVKVVLEVENFDKALAQMTATDLRILLGDLFYNDIPFQKGHIQADLQDRLSRWVTDYGAELTNLNLADIRKST